MQNNTLDAFTSYSVKGNRCGNVCGQTRVSFIKRDFPQERSSVRMCEQGGVISHLKPDQIWQRAVEVGLTIPWKDL